MNPDTEASETETDSTSEAESAETLPPRRWAVKVGCGIDVLLAGVLSFATFLVHDVRYILTEPFWNDESWVAISTKLPLDQLLRVTASSPPGWTMLLRLVPFGYPYWIRIVPLLFGAFTVVAAYGYVRSLPWPTVLLGRLAATIAGVAALLVPSALTRNDLKQYTSDAFVTLVVLWLMSRLESHWSRRRLLQFASLLAVGFLFSAAAIFVGTAAFGALIVAQLISRQWRRLAESAVVGTVCGVVLVGTYLVVYRPGAPPELNEYWARYYLPLTRGLGATRDFLVKAQERMVGGLGVPLIVVVVLLAMGVITLVLMRRIACALLVPILLVVMVVLAAARQYPLFDVRTSHFLATAIVVTAAIGVAGLAALAARAHVAVAVVIALVAVLLFATRAPVTGHIRTHSIPREDLGTPTGYIAAHVQPGDTIVVGMLSSWGFAYHWPTGTPEIAPVSSNLQRFVTVYPDQPHILVALDRTPAAADEVMARAIEKAQQPDASGRIWVIHAHTKPDELAQYGAAATAAGLTGTTIIPRVLALLTVPRAR